MRVDYRAMSKYRYPFYILLHPVDGYRELKNNNKFSLLFANILLAAWVLLTILNWGYIDYDFRTRYDEIQLGYVFLTTIVAFAMAVIANWCFCTLMDGKGRFSEIWVCLAYALLPYLIGGYIRFFLSFYLTQEEAVFLTYLMVVMEIWSALLVFFGLSGLHDYSFPKTIGSIALTALGLLIMIFLIILIAGVVTQIYGFFVTVFSEIFYRIQ